jgi:hypothetical protein
MMATTTSIPTHIPALKMPPITSQELRVTAIANAQSHKEAYCFMSALFPFVMQKLCRTKQPLAQPLRKCPGTSFNEDLTFLWKG